MRSIRRMRLRTCRAKGGHFHNDRRRWMRRDDQCRWAMEANETERTETVVNSDRGAGDIFVLGGERMEMRNANRLRQKQYRRGDTGYPAHPASPIGKCWLHQV